MDEKKLHIKKNYPLGRLTTIGVGGKAKYFKVIDSGEEAEGLNAVVTWAKKKNLPIFVLGGGSNVVVADRGFSGLTLRIMIDSLEISKENKKFIWLLAGAGLGLNQLVSFTVAHNYQGIENLTWIPGSVGGAVYQNAGAYGQEIGEVVDKVQVWVIEAGKIMWLSNKECCFGYRESIFSRQQNKYIILKVGIKLQKQGKLKLTYLDLNNYFKNKKMSKIKLIDIKKAVMEIRKNKLAMGGEWGSAGSFFKNLLLSQKDYNLLVKNLKNNFGEEAADRARELKEKFSTDEKIKIPTAWLIDLCGLKGKTVGQVKVFEKQALFLLAKQGAKASEVMRLFQLVRRMVYTKTGMKIEPEVKFAGFAEKEMEKYLSLNK